MSSMWDYGASGFYGDFGTNNAEHYFSFISQGGAPERYGEWLKLRFDFDESRSVIIHGKKGRSKVIRKIDNLDFTNEEADSRKARIAAYNAENDQTEESSYH